MDALVTTEWLAGELGAADLRVADASWFLPEYKRDAQAEFAEGHIPGAVFLDLDSFADKGNPLPSMLPPPEQLASRMQALGLGDGCRIVLYDDSPLHTSARAWWMLTAFGTPDVAILDGGLAKWKAEKRPVETGEDEAKPRHFTVRHAAEGVRALADVKAVAASHPEQIVDARSPSRFAGLDPEPRPGVQPGHIPGSRNAPYADFFHPDGSWKRDITLRAAFENAGVEVEHPILATCGSGITAAVIVFAAHLLGHKATLYDGSWSEWGADAHTPKARGA
jgi:thiosulfate/3-mercaptopyruvate sulfurtransferase